MSNQTNADEATTYSARKRSIPTLKPRELEALRVRTWFANVLVEAGLPDGTNDSIVAKLLDTQVSELPSPSNLLQAWLKEYSGPLDDRHVDALTNVSRQRYESGGQSPNDLTLDALDAVLPGTRDVYEFGPSGESLWLVLAGDRDTCETHLLEMFPPPRGRFGFSFDEKVQQLFDALLAPEWRGNFVEVAASYAGRPLAHPVWRSYVQTTQFGDMPDEESAGLLPMRPVEDCVIGSIAAWWTAIHRREGPILELEWLIVGLCQGVVASELTGDIQTYLLNLVREQAQEIDRAVAPPRGAVKPFEERWTQQVDLG
ncbi:hypothetical protein SAMN05216466_105245 [Paraburkholderia phenazinium]|uniref:Uncharacterized protein n=1 Tax=Paraburkholderia phenazinium TaxID=60549 RepID=A0A1G7XAJ8_9BURK|nr:hypothetical protein [Paraburkholderia phenazinium]SDG80580.1 hypothetical protein SAMN05216466_105245 [Paraburkholderia phenazinium]